MNNKILFADLDHLKEINDSFGHIEGDFSIRHCAEVLKKVVGADGIVGRIGGDEFCCIIPKAKDFNVERFIQKLYQDVEVFNNKNIIPTEAAIACGYAFFTAEDTDIEKVRERADEMMYQNKKKLKGRD